MAGMDERLRDSLVVALACADAAGNTLIGAMLADCLAQLEAQVARDARPATSPADPAAIVPRDRRG